MLDARAEKIQQEAFKQAIETLSKDNENDSRLSNMKILVTGNQNIYNFSPDYGQNF